MQCSPRRYTALGKEQTATISNGSNVYVTNGAKNTLARQLGKTNCGESSCRIKSLVNAAYVPRQ
jgi:hypothetical protein